VSTTPRSIRLARPDVGAAELEAVAEVLASGTLTMGPKVGEFERAVAEAVGTADAVVVSSGTAALHLAVLALGIGPGDEVIVPAYTFPATANVVELSGARAVIVDVDPKTFLVRPELVAAAVTPRTKAVLAVHLFGRPVDWEALRASVPEGVALVEDAAGALGARWRGVPCGSLGVLGCLSFHPRKIVTTGEGGAVTTDDPGIAEQVRRGRHHGLVAGAEIDLPKPGLNYRLPDVLCALGLPQLARLEELLAARERVAGWYTERLEEAVGVPGADPGDRHGWQAYVVRVDHRDDVRAELAREGIESQIGTYALNRLSAYQGRGAFPGADRAFERALALPFATSLSENDVERVCSALLRACA
jgi:perosamine synthetase